MNQNLFSYATDNNKDSKIQRNNATLLFLLFLTISYRCWGKEIVTLESFHYSSDLLKKMKNGTIITETSIRDLEKEKFQSLDFSISGLHPKKCNYALKKLSQYERFDKFLTFVSRSDYSEKTQRISLHLESLLLPFNMLLDFKIERITKEGVYFFTFDRGFLKNLQGEIHISSFDSRCFFFSKAYWKGPDTSIPAPIFEFFTNALSKLAMENLFRISSTLTSDP